MGKQLPYSIRSRSNPRRIRPVTKHITNRIRQHYFTSNETTTRWSLFLRQLEWKTQSQD